MKIQFSDKDKRNFSIAAVLALIVIYITNKIYCKITDIAYVNSIPYEVQIKCGYVFPETVIMLLKDGYEVKSRRYGHRFYFQGRDLYKNNKKVITIKNDDEYQKTKTTPFVRI